MRLEEIGGVIAEELKSVAPLGHGRALDDEALELHGADFRAVLLLLAALLVVLVAVELALDAVAGAMEEVHRRPEQVLEIGFDAGVRQRRDEGVEDVGERASDGVLIGQGTRIRLVLMRMIAVDLQFVDDAVGRGRGMERLEVGVLVDRHGGGSVDGGRAHRGLRGEKAADGPGLHRQAQRGGRSGAEEGREATVLLRDAKAGAGVPTRPVAWGGARRRKTVADRPCRPGPSDAHSPSRRPWVRLSSSSGAMPPADGRDTVAESTLSFPAPSGRKQEAQRILRDELVPQRPAELSQVRCVEGLH